MKNLLLISLLVVSLNIFASQDDEWMTTATLDLPGSIEKSNVPDWMTVATLDFDEAEKRAAQVSKDKQAANANRNK